MLRRDESEGVVYHGDWHTVVLNALNFAEKSTSAPELLELFAQLRETLMKNDECRHDVTVRSPLPFGLDAEFVATCVRDCLEDAEAILDITEPGYISVIMTKRGTSEYAHAWVAEGIEHGIRYAKFILGARR